MLVDNKFFYISLPRCGSTSFHYSCIINGIDVKSVDSNVNFNNSKVDFTNVEQSDIMNFIDHGHDTLIELQKKYGYDLPIIAVNRNKHERFYSLYKHIIFDLDRVGLTDLSYTFANFTLDELFFFTKNDLISNDAKINRIKKYLFDNQYKTNNSKLELHDYVVNILNIFLSPISHWTNNNPNIIWFEFDKLDKLDEWVTNTICKPFKMESLNSSKHIKCNIELNDEFIKRYNDIYDYYDIQKINKTLI